MRPVKLVMENFGAFSGRAEIDFSKLEDIFLITGRTGSGKTTIFDAVCFALYGKVPGSRGDHTSRLVSDHAAPQSNCRVSLEFFLGEKCYLAERSPRQERPKKRGEGTISTEETLVLYEISGGAKTNPITKKSEGDAKLKALIGLEAEEFFKIVLLPQGEFAEFLRENTNERQKVLGKLFPVEKAMKVKELARKKAGEAEAEAKGAAGNLDEISRRINPETYDTDYAEALAALKKADEKNKNLERDAVLFDRLVNLRRDEKEAESRLDESLKLFEENTNAESLTGAKEKALFCSRSARSLERYLRGIESAEKAAAASAEALAAAIEEKKAAGKIAENAEKNMSEAGALERDRLALREKRPALMEMIEEEKALAVFEDEFENQNVLAGKLSNEAEILKENLRGQNQIIKEKEEVAAGQNFLEGEREFSKSIKDIFLDFRGYRERLDELEKEKLNIEKEIGSVLILSDKTRHRAVVLNEEIEKLRYEKKLEEEAGMAGRLSVLLEKGKPCPVCGSVEHPNPAREAKPQFALKERITAQEESLLEAEKTIAGADTALEAKKTGLAKNNEAINRLIKEALEKRQNFPHGIPAVYPDNPFALENLKNNAPLPSAEVINNVIKIEAEKLNGILVRLKEGKDASSGLRELYRQKDEILAGIAEAEKKLVAAEEQKKNLLSRIESSREKHRSLLNSTELSGFVFKNAEEALLRLDASIEETEKHLAALKAENENAALRLSAAKAGMEAVLRNKDECTARLEEAKVFLNGALEKSVFSSAGEAEKSLLETAEEEKIEKEIRLWRENRAGLETKISEQKKQLGAIRSGIAETFRGKTGQAPDLEEAAGQLDSIREERTSAGEERNIAFARFTNLEKDMSAFVDAKKRYDDLAAKAGKLKALSDDLSGKNPKKIPFDSWLLAIYLEEAAAYASVRLKKMSEGRYSLLLDSDRQQSRGYAGLDLMVFDAYTGRTRPCATLSGGESFMASISLALGLADSIQNRSGGVRLDAVFIDEGFGTLDETSLDKALFILDELRDRRMVGLISHVGELRARIPCRVEVIKTGTGSRIETSG